jgi:hypothetical protein
MSIRVKGKAEAGIAHIAVIAMLVVLVIAVGAMYFMVKSQAGETRNKDANVAEDLPATESGNSNLNSLQMNQRNTSRKNDASKLLAAANEYMANNSGHVPTQYAQNRLSGGEDTTPSIVTFEMYKTVVIESGEQTPPGADELRLVTGAACGENGATVEASSRSLAAQYVLEKIGGGYTYKCQE